LISTALVVAAVGERKPQVVVMAQVAVVLAELLAEQFIWMRIKP
jgi:hypothetical protein